MKARKKGIIAVLAIAMTSAIASMATGCKLVDNIKQKIEQAKCEHATEVVTEIKPATCTESGLTEGVKCGDCDKWLVEPDEIPALGHEVVKDEAVPATCLASGLTEGSHCSRCEETVKKQETVKATGHKLVAVEAKEATCTEAGNTAGQKCETCGVIYQGCEEIPLTEHNFVEGKCEICDKVLSVTTLAVGESVAGRTITENRGEDSFYEALSLRIRSLYPDDSFPSNGYSFFNVAFSDGSYFTISSSKSNSTYSMSLMIEFKQGDGDVFKIWDWQDISYETGVTNLVGPDSNTNKSFVFADGVTVTAIQCPDGELGASMRYLTQRYFT